jgi:DNA-binding NarL/FixJ family response regulator
MIAPNPAPTALVVDDSPRWRILMAEILRDNGWAVTAAAAVPEEAPPQLYDLVLCDPGFGDSVLPNLDRLDQFGERIVLITGAGPADLPPGAVQRKRVLGVIEKAAFSAAGLLALSQPLVAAARPDASAAAGPKILVVEDDANWRSLYEELLGDAGCAPYFAVSYGEGRGWLQRMDFELAIVDLNLASSAAPQGNRDGFHLLRAARQRGVPALVVSALGDPADVDRAYDDFGIFAFIEKEGFDRRRFRRLLDEARRSGPDDSQPAPEAGATPAALDQLTPRERDVLELLIQGLTNRQIAEALLISPNTTKKHVDHILQKMSVSTRAGAVAAALQSGLKPVVPPGDAARG